MAPSSSNSQGGPQKRQENQDCPALMYYDTAIPGCTSCDHLCDYHEVQGTTQQCKAKCYGYYMLSSTTLPVRTTAAATRKPHQRGTDMSVLKPGSSQGQFNGDKGNATLAVVVLLLALVFAGVGYHVCRRVKGKPGCRRRRAEDKKTSVPCSEEDGLPSVGGSQKPLIEGSSGPICQAENCPEEDPYIAKRQFAVGGENSFPYTLTFADFGGPQYAVLDGPLTSVHSHSTVPKEVYEEEDALTSESLVTAPKETYSDVSGEHLNTQSVRFDGESQLDREYDLSTS